MSFSDQSFVVLPRVKRTRIGHRLVVGATVALGGLALFTGSASAHITPQNPEGPAGGYMATAFKVGHGCDGSPTTKVEIKIPDGVTSVAPQPVAGWELSTTNKTLDPPIDMHGTKITETVGTVTWSGGSLPSDQLQMFWLSMKLPDGKAGDVVSFPIIQTCEVGQTDWIEIAKPGEDEPQHPAPTITLTATTEEHGSSGSVDNGSAEDVSSGDASDSGSKESAADSSDESSGNGLAIGGLVLGALGFVTGGAAFAKASKKD
ncbi:MAG TPA: YcnI family protein [Microthrixaceae bacterium]|nr:YcnI family protein [Microthrixaceae bacterium]